MMNIEGTDLSFLEELYETYKKNPAGLESSWQKFFAHIEHEEEVEAPFKKEYSISLPADLRIARLISAYRTYGHLKAKINPIAVETSQADPLRLETLGFSEKELNEPFPTCGILQKPTATLKEIIETLNQIYCNKIGIEYMGLENPDLEKWIQERIEPTQFVPELNIQQKEMILQRLNRSELLETFIHTKYTGQKRFSLEGSETLIPMLEAIIETGSTLSLKNFYIGMAHRGRLNVLSNILNKSYSELFSEFEESYIPISFEGTGDVKYHKGFSSEVRTPDGQIVQIALTPNPSHLEAVDAVVEGQTRAKQVLLHDDVAQKQVIPILIHGDAAIAGQGVMYETLQFSKLPGYSTGGTVHIVINNQVGFTAAPEETRSTRYCTDIARSFGCPVFHVNAEDPEGCVYAATLAVEIRQKFHCDVFIDLNCYRKYGHNEADEPAYTQPLEYQQIRQKKPIRELYRNQLEHEGVVEKHIVEDLEKEFIESLNTALKISREPASKEEEEGEQKLPQIAPIKTGMSKEILLKIAEKLCFIPEDFNIHPKLKHLIQERLSMVAEEKKPIDWGMAETLAYGSLLWEQISVRLSGQDSGRGTFSHRHALWTDQKEERKKYSPLQHLKEKQGRFDVYNSPLSEYAILGFEFGYCTIQTDALVIWEAQFGDFSNCAQVVIDQFIATAEQKWGQKFGLVLFLPHGYEGQGPEHSSGRMERFLALSGEDNMRVVNPTTPAQFFHLLRKQALNPIKKPLIVFTPKGLLRYPASFSHVKELEDGNFQEMIDDHHPGKSVDQVVLCSGRIYYDLLAEREKRKSDRIALIRIEQLYPLNTQLLKSILEKYPNMKELIWAQEEPSNMGAWHFLHGLLRDLLPKDKVLRYVGRERSASPAAGSYALHKKQHKQLIEALFKE